MEMLLLSLIILTAIVLFITQWLPIEVTAILLIPALYFSGLLPLGDAFSGFSSSATITIAAMYILSAGLSRTGSLDFLVELIRKFSGGSLLRILLLLAITMPLISAFMNNTPVVVMMVPVLLALARDFNLKPSKLMIPLSYFTILGGTITLIGTSTNIIVNELYREAGGPGFRLFDFAPMGIIYAIGGISFMILIGKRLLPERSTLASMLPRERTAKFVTEIVVDSQSKLIGNKPSDIFQTDAPVRLIEIVRNEEVTLGAPAMQLQLMAEDALIIEGTSKDIASFLAKWGASLASVVEDDQRVPIRSTELLLSEAIVLPDSPFIGRTVAELGLNRRYGVKVLAVQRRGRHHRYKVREMRMKPGDVLLLQSEASGFSNLRDSEAVLIVEGLEKVISQTHRRWLALVIMASVVGLAAFSPIPIAILAVSGALAMVILRCLRLDEALRSMDLSILLLLAGTIPLGAAMQQTGMAERIVDFFLAVLGEGSPVLLVSAFYLLTIVLTALLSNSATAVLLTPIAIGLGQQLGVDPKPFLVAVAFAASADFATPIGYQTNTIVFGPGGYRFSDYLKVGIPMEILMWILATILIPIFWPFHP